MKKRQRGNTAPSANPSSNAVLKIIVRCMGVELITFSLNLPSIPGGGQDICLDISPTTMTQLFKKLSKKCPAAISQIMGQQSAPAQPSNPSPRNAPKEIAPDYYQISTSQLKMYAIDGGSQPTAMKALYHEFSCGHNGQSAGLGQAMLYIMPQTYAIVCYDKVNYVIANKVGSNSRSYITELNIETNSNRPIEVDPNDQSKCIVGDDTLKHAGSPGCVTHMV